MNFPYSPAGGKVEDSESDVEPAKGNNPLIVKLMPGIGHLPMLEVPKESTQFHRGFLARTVAVSSPAAH